MTSKYNLSGIRRVDYHRLKVFEPMIDRRAKERFGTKRKLVSLAHAPEVGEAFLTLRKGRGFVHPTLYGELSSQNQDLLDFYLAEFRAVSEELDKEKSYLDRKRLFLDFCSRGSGKS